MNTPIEDQIWDRIITSAKSKFDYESFQAKFKNFNEAIPERIVFHLIVSYASGEEEEYISENLKNELTSIGYQYEDQNVYNFVKKNHEAFSAEIYAAYLAFSLLEEGEEQHKILETVSTLLYVEPK